MGFFNRNIIIQADVNRLMNPDRPNPQTLVEGPPGGFIPTLMPTPAPKGPAAGGPSPDGAGPDGAGPDGQDRRAQRQPL